MFDTEAHETEIAQGDATMEFDDGYWEMRFRELEVGTASDAGVATIPPGLGEMAPGSALGAILESIDVDRLSGYDRIVYLRVQQRMASHYNAGVYRAMASVVEYMRSIDDDYRLATEAAAAEIRVALRLTRRATDSEVSFALELRERLPRVMAALAAGDIDVRRAKTIAHHTIHVSAATAQAVVDEIIDLAPGWTTGQLAARLRKLCIAAGPEEARSRYELSLEQRRLVAEPTTEGTANVLGLGMPPDLVTAAMNRINTLARRMRRHGETRTMDQLRADVFLDLLAGRDRSRGQGGTRRGVIDVQVDLETLMRLNDDPGELAGYGPVIADIARDVAEQQTAAEWRFTVTDPKSGQTLHNGLVRRRPTAQQRRYVEARQRTCIFPGCRMPAISSDIDHRRPYSDGGPTEEQNLGPVCRYDHCLRHRFGWTYASLSNGDHLWTTRLGHTYTTSGTPP